MQCSLCNVHSCTTDVLFLHLQKTDWCLVDAENSPNFVRILKRHKSLHFCAGGVQERAAYSEGRAGPASLLHDEAATLQPVARAVRREAWV